jgi:hypothetical protein
MSSKSLVIFGKTSDFLLKLPFSENVSKSLVVFYKSLTLSLKKPQNCPKCLSLLEQASISLKTSSKSLVIFENVFKKPQNCSKCLTYLENASLCFKKASIPLKMYLKSLGIFEN